MFWAGVVLPAVLFGVLYLYPWLERAVTKDRAEHHVLQRPRDVPGRVAVGAYGITFFAFLLLAGANDLAARQFGIKIFYIIWFMRIATLVVPVLVAAIAYGVARRLKRSEAPMLSALPRDELVRGLEEEFALGAADGSENPREEAKEEPPDEAGEAPADLPAHTPVDPGEAPPPHPPEPARAGPVHAGGRRR